MPSNPVNTHKCAACRAHGDKAEMIRVCRTADGRVFVDSDKNSGGRGVWVHRNGNCVDVLAKKKALNAAFKCQVADDVYKRLYDEL